MPGESHPTLSAVASLAWAARRESAFTAPLHVSHRSVSASSAGFHLPGFPQWCVGVRPGGHLAAPVRVEPDSDSGYAWFSVFSWFSSTLADCRCLKVVKACLANRILLIYWTASLRCGRDTPNSLGLDGHVEPAARIFPRANPQVTNRGPEGILFTVHPPPQVPANGDGKCCLLPWPGQDDSALFSQVSRPQPGKGPELGRKNVRDCPRDLRGAAGPFY